MVWRKNRFRANSDIRIIASGATRSDGLVLKDVDRINGSDGSDGSDGGGDQGENPLG